MSDRVPDLLVEKLALGELSATQAADVRARLEAAADTRLEALDASNAAILQAHPPAEVARQVRQRLAALDDTEQRERRVTASWLWAPAAMAAAALLLWWLVQGVGGPAVAGAGDSEVIAKVEPPVAPSGKAGPIIDDGKEQIFIKGDPRLVIHKKADGTRQHLKANDNVTTGDLLQMFYVSAGRTQGVIVSIDGAGSVTLHHPAQADAPPVLKPGGPIPLPFAYELDDAPQFERFFLVTVREGDVQVDTVMEAAQALAQSGKAQTDPLAVPKGWEQHDLLLNKR